MPLNELLAKHARAEDRLRRVQDLQAAHAIIARAFEALDSWHMFVPVWGFILLRRRAKLLRIGRYLLLQAVQINQEREAIR